MGNFKTETVKFEKALPVWPFGRESEMNFWISFRTIANGAEKTVLRLTGSSAYIVKVGGEFVAFGPARCAHGFFRVDELDLSKYVKDRSVITISVAGYNTDSFYHIDQPSFLCAELIENGSVSAATGDDGFICRVMTEHEQKAERYAGQRTYCETTNLTPMIEKWEKDEIIDPRKFAMIQTAIIEDKKKFIARGCDYETYFTVPASSISAKIDFDMFTGDTSRVLYPAYIVPRKVNTSPTAKQFSLGEVETDVFIKGRNIIPSAVYKKDCAPTPQMIECNKGVAYKMPSNLTGQIVFDVLCDEDTEILVKFDEVTGEDGLVNFRRMYTVNAAVFRFESGSYHASTFEPYTMSAIEIYVTKGKATISNVGIVYFGANDTDKKYIGDDKNIEKIYKAAVETYRQNTFTIFMDCPSRERAGWLCDSFFTSRVEKVLTGKSTVERNFLENFFLPDGFKAIPKGMFSECYPGDHYNGGYIANWAMWLVLELEEYLARSGDREFIDNAKERIYDLLDFFKPYEDSDGLITKLKGWIFVEWSKANELTQDINYPTNMLYAKMLISVANMYGDTALYAKAERIKQKINENAITEDGFYCDNAVFDENGVAHLSGECTEACQYYAFFCGVATKEQNPTLWDRLMNDFGPERVVPGKWPELKPEAKWQSVYPANSFIGNYLRLELLSLEGENEKLLENIRGFFLYMAETTGTLWENANSNASCCHGFASHVIYWLDKMGYIK